MSGFSWYVAEDTVGGEGAAMVMGGTGEVDQDIGMGGAFSVPDSGVTVCTDQDGGGMDRIGEATILIMGVIHMPAMDI
jgi:hypothetical protein